MPIYETKIKTDSGPITRHIRADDSLDAMMQLEKLHGGPDNILVKPYDLSDRLNLLKSAARVKNKDKSGREKEYVSLKTHIPKEFIRHDPWCIEYLYMISTYATRGILDLGRERGGTTLIYSYASNNLIPIYSIDINSTYDDSLISLINQSNLNPKLDLIVGDYQHIKHEKITEYDLISLDVEPTYDLFMNYLNTYYDGLSPGGHVICNSCYFGTPAHDAIVDFVSNKKIITHLSPFINNQHWIMPHGDLCHFQKPFAGMM